MFFFKKTTTVVNWVQHEKTVNNEKKPENVIILHAPVLQCTEFFWQSNSPFLQICEKPKRNLYVILLKIYLNEFLAMSEEKGKNLLFHVFFFRYPQQISPAEALWTELLFCASQIMLSFLIFTYSIPGYIVEVSNCFQALMFTPVAFRC